MTGTIPKIVLVWCLSIAFLTREALGLTEQDFYNFGLGAGDKVLEFFDEVSSEEIQLRTPIRLFGTSHRSCYVNQNGLISFGTDLPYYANQEITRFQKNLIAVFYADVDTKIEGDPDKGNGNVFYREETENSRLLQGASKLVQQNFKDATNFQASSLLIATWDNVGYYESKADKRNSFQTVIVSDGQSSYAALLYGKIDWIQSDGKESPMRPDMPGQAGFVAEDGRHQTIIGSGTDAVAEIAKLSNIDQPGLFIFRISDPTGPVDPRAVGMTDTDIESSLGDDYGPDYVYEDDDLEEMDDIPPPPPPPPGLAAARGPVDGEIDNRVLAAENDGESVVLNENLDVDQYTDEYYDDDYLDEYNVCPPTAEPCPEDCQSIMDDEGCPLCVCSSIAGNSGGAARPNENQAQPVRPVYPDSVNNVEENVNHNEPPNKEKDARPAPPLRRSEENSLGENERPMPAESVEPERPYEAPYQPAQPAEAVPQAGINSGGAMTCAAAGENSGCHGDAVCRDYHQGYCCECNPGFYGNGKECLKKEDPQRINGRLTADLNGVQIEANDIHTYVVTSDGRAYTALSQIPPNLGPSLLLLDSIGGVMGWLFAKVSSPAAYNGFTLTGGLFNRTATVHVGESHTVTIQQDFSGRDVYHYFKANVFVTGSLPQVPADAQVEINEYREEYRRVGPGIVKSYSNRIARVNGQEHQITVDQTIRYDECSFKAFDMEPLVTLISERSYVVYDPAEQIVRYASANTIEGPQRAGSDPCQQGRHTCTEPNQLCVAEGESYRCLCMEGYQLIYANNDVNAGATCADLDECAKGTNNCDVNAECYNMDGSFTCRCRSGFVGNGVTCQAEERQQPSSLCGSYECHGDADCLPAPNGGQECVCKQGFYGNGVDCRPLDHPQPPATTEKEIIGPVCSAHADCSQYGMCAWNEAVNHYQCRCRPPYSGDGVHCFLEAETCDVAHNCDSNADCVYEQTQEGDGYKCRCKPGFTGDGLSCIPLQSGGGNVECNMLNNCHPDAQCVYNSALGQHVCQCLVGFSGDGYDCISQSGKPLDSRCRSTEDCHPSAHCIIPENGGDDYVCECFPGFSGDGVTYCEPADECSPAEPNAVCSAYATCGYRQEARAYVCQCNQGYEGDGKTCVLAGQPEPEEESCDTTPSLCHQNAQCVFNREYNKHECQCWLGYQGDGYSQCDRIDQGCETLHNCHRDADCIQDRATGRYFCKCRFGYRGDGTNCSPEVSCYDNRELCDENADCLPSERTYECKCRTGFHGNGQTCSADSEQRGQMLVIAQGMTLIKRALRPDEMGQQLVVVPHQIAVGIAFDCQDERLFWSDVSGHAIRSSELDGSNVTIVLEKELNSPEGIVIDFSSRNIYYADSGNKEIGVATLDGQYQTSLISDGLVNPRALAIDVQDKKLYYSDWNREAPVIGRMALDGTQREDFITEDISLPNHLVILERRRELCWVDAGKNRLECVNLNGQGRRVVHAPLSFPFGLTVRNEETFYWTDWDDLKIHSVSVYGGQETSMAPSVGGSGKLYGILAIPEQCPQGQTECSVDNGGCDYLCLPRPESGLSCACPDNVDAPDCNKLEKLKLS